MGEAETSQQVLKGVSESKPEILLLDMLLVAADSDLLGVLQQKHRIAKVLLIEASKEEGASLRGVHQGIAGVVPRQAPYRQLLDYIRRASAGESILDTRLAAVAPKEASGIFPAGPREKGSSPLSARELQVVQFVSQGFKNREIAQRMFISEQTVKNHLHNIFDKLGVSDRLELALYAIHKDLQGVA